MASELEAAEKRIMDPFWWAKYSDHERKADKETIVQAHLAALKRAQEPITTEGLKECGFEHFGCYDWWKWRDPKGQERILVKADPRGFYWEDEEENHIHPAPVVLADVDNLLARLTR